MIEVLRDGLKHELTLTPTDSVTDREVALANKILPSVSSNSI